MTDPLLKTPLYDIHVGMGARMVEFGGWAMPLEYSGIVPEHMAVRTCVGLFDESGLFVNRWRGNRSGSVGVGASRKILVA